MVATWTWASAKIDETAVIIQADSEKQLVEMITAFRNANSTLSLTSDDRSAEQTKFNVIYQSILTFKGKLIVPDKFQSDDAEKK